GDGCLISQIRTVIWLIRQPSPNFLPPPQRGSTHTMKRYPMFDPPEYLEWKAEPAVLKAYQDTIQRDRERARIIGQLDQGQLIAMYAGMMRFRLHDITLRR